MSGDFDGDGDEDIVVSSYADDFLIFYTNNGSGSFSFSSTKAVGLEPGVLETIDLNDDSILDLVVSQPDGGYSHVYLGNGNGTFQSRITFDSVGYFIDIDFADIDNDGRIDMVGSNVSGATSEVAVFLNQGSGIFSSRRTFVVGLPTYAVELGDFNEDGKVDIVTGHNGARMSILFGNGDGTFQTHQTIGSAEVS